jgi:TatD DNase family protein
VAETTDENSVAGGKLSYVDAHIHLADPAYDRVEPVLDDAAANNVDYLLSNGMDFESSLRTIDLSKRYDKVIAAVGVHPWTVTNANAALDLSTFEQLIEDNKKQVRAIGEIGLDGKYRQDEVKKQRQNEAFLFFLALAERRTLPVVIHSRLAIDEILEILPSFRLVGVLLHWYSGPSGNLRLIKDRGYLISVGPSILYSKRVAEIAREADLSIILTETDGPVSYYGPFKDRPTHPSFVIPVVKKLSEIKNKSAEEIRKTIWNNFHSFISLNKQTSS